MFFLFVVSACIALTGCGQSSTAKDQKSRIIVGGSCEGCEAVYESPVPLDQLNNVDTLPDFNDAGPKIEISGIIYHRDGKTPAAGVVLYVYHTDQTGVYPKQGNEKGWAKRHGFIRGWVKTDKNGFYKFYTLVPASYPDSRNPKHIHPTIKEPDKNEYWIDEYLFEGDPYLQYEKSDRPPRGSNGIIKPVMKDGMLRATRNIILGLNVPDYPKADVTNVQSGLAIGANWCEQQRLTKIALVWVPSPVDQESSRLFKINPDGKNTVFVYKKRKVAARWVNLDYTGEDADNILNQL